MQITLINYIHNPRLSIVAAARSSAPQLNIQQLWNALDSQQINGLFDQFLNSGHPSPFNHTIFTFGIMGISRIAGQLQKIKDELKKWLHVLTNELKPKCYNPDYCNEQISCGIYPTHDFVTKT